MSRLMSVALTETQVRDRTKTQTRRLGWRFVKPGDQLTLVRKAMGRKRKDGTVEPLVRIADVEVVAVARQPLCDIATEDVAREGFPGWTRWQFVDFFCEHMKCHQSTEVTVITWRYL